MNQDTTLDKKKSGGKYYLLGGALIASLGINMWQYNKTPMTATSGEKKAYSRAYITSRDTVCSDTITMAEAQAWIETVDRANLRFNNKSIFICADAVRLMYEREGFSGIWVRRGMDDMKIIHDIAWPDLGGVTAENAYLLESKSCVCAPCCGDDTSDFEEYVPGM